MSWELLAIMILEYVLIMAVVLGEVFFVPVGKENTTFTVVETNMEEVCAKVAEEYGLTRREAEVLTIMAAGYSMPYIQEKLCIERGTVTSHCSHIYQKLGVHKRDELYDLLAKKAREPSQR